MNKNCLKLILDSKIYLIEAIQRACYDVIGDGFYEIKRKHFNRITIAIS